MAWLAPLIPVAYDMLRPKPGAPNFNFSRPDRSEYINQLLRTGFDPNNELYRLAQERTMAKVNSSLAERGIMGSAGEQFRSGTMTDLANKYVENALQRQIQTMNTVNAYDSGGLPFQQAQSNQDWRVAGLDEQRGQADVRNIGAIVNTGVNAWDKYKANQEYQTYRDENNAKFDRYMRAIEGSQASSGGRYYGGGGNGYLGMDYDMGRR